MPRAQEAQERRVSVLHTVSQDERYIAREHMDVRRDCVSFAQRVISGLCQFCTALLNQHGRQGGVVSCFRTCREPIHGGANSTSCLVRS